MFRLAREKYVKALETSEEMLTILEQENSNLRLSGNILSNNWWGNQANKSIGMINKSLDVGNHVKAYMYTKNMVNIMSEYLPEIERMMAKREQIGEQLKQDEYVVPDLTHFSEKELIVNYDYIDDVKADADGAIMYGDAAANVLREMINDATSVAGEYVNMSVASELLESGKRKLHRVDNYKAEFEDFAKKMSDMEYNMSFDLESTIKSQGDKIEMVKERTLLDIGHNKEIKTAQQLEKELRVKNISNDKIRHARKILKGSPSKLTLEEKSWIASVFEDIYIVFDEKIDTFLDEASKTLESYAESFLDFKYTVEGILDDIVTTDWLTIVKQNISDIYKEDIVPFLEEIEKIPGATVKDTINNLDDFTGGKLKDSIYKIMTICAENGIGEKAQYIYDLVFSNEYYREMQKIVINKWGWGLPSAFEDWIINEGLEAITHDLLGFNYDPKTGAYYTSEGSLQNSWGFGTAIDEFAPILGMDLLHEDIVFQANGKEYLVELWKGEYGWGITSGGEVGIYTRTLEEAKNKPYKMGEKNYDIFYDCAEGDDQLHIVTTMYDMSGEYPREICTKDTANHNEDGTDYWNLNFKSWDAVDKEDIKMEIQIEGDVEIIAGINKYFVKYNEENGNDSNYDVVYDNENPQIIYIVWNNE